MKRRNCLESAVACACGGRESDHGKPENNFQAIADLWSAYTGRDFSAVDVAVMMALLKIARIKTGGKRADSFIDLAGYAACACELATESPEYPI